MTCYHSNNLVICTGVTGEWTLTRAYCPWCCCQKGETIRAASRETFSGYCAPDMVCGECGHRWSWDMDNPFKHTPDEKRERNIALVAGLGKVEG